MASVASAGPQSGRTMRKKMRYSPAPSTRAASRSSLGMPIDELAHQEGAERPDQERQDQPEVGVGQSHVRDQHEQRHERDDRRHHQRGEHHHEQHPLARELQLGQGVADHRAEQQVAERDAEGDDHRVEEVAGEVEAVPQLAIVLHRRVVRDERRRQLSQLGRRLEGSEDHPHERADHQHEADHEPDV